MPDMETNFYDEKKFTVRHIRDKKGGGELLTEERDIYELIANMGARRKRACLEAVIPGDVIETAQEECYKTLKASVEITPELIKKIIDMFDEFGVTQEHLKKRIQRNLDAITPAQVIDLRRIYMSMKDGMSQPEQWFVMDAAATVEADTSEKKEAKKRTTSKKKDDQGVPAEEKKSKTKQGTEKESEPEPDNRPSFMKKVDEMNKEKEAAKETGDDSDLDALAQRFGNME